MVVPRLDPAVFVLGEAGCEPASSAADQGGRSGGGATLGSDHFRSRVVFKANNGVIESFLKSKPSRFQSGPTSPRRRPCWC